MPETESHSLTTSDSANIKGQGKRASSTPLFILISFVVVLLLASVYAHYKVAASADNYSGLISILDRTFDLALASMLTAAAFCTGRRIARTLKLSFLSLAEELSLSVMLGTGIIGLGLLGLGLLGQLRLLPVVVLMGLMVLASYREATRLQSVVREGFSAVTSTRERTIIALLFALLVVLMLLRAATPPHAYDEAIYHLAATKRFVQRGAIYPLYDNPQGNMPFLVQMFYAVCLLFKSDIATKFLSLILAIMTAFALYAFCVRFLTRRTGVVALFAFFSAGMVFEVAVTARVDVILAGMLFAATYAMMVYLEREERGWLWTSAALAGFSLGIKYTAATWLLPVGIMFLFERLIRRRESFITVFKHGLLYTCIAFLLASPWLIKNYVWFQNPVYNFGTGEVAEYEAGRIRYFTPEDERKLDAHFEAARKEWPEIADAIEDDLAAAAVLHVERNPLRFWEFFTRADAYTVSEPFHTPNFLFLLIPLIALVNWRRRWIIWLAILSAAFFLLMAFSSWIARYYLPLYPALTILAAFTLTGLVERLRSRAPIIKVLPAVALAISLATVSFVSLTEMLQRGSLSFVTGAMSRREFMNRSFYYPSIDYVNRELPANTRVLMIGAQMAYDMNRDYLADTSWDTTEWRRLLVRNDSLEAVHEDLKRQGVTHVMFSPGVFTFAAMIGQQSSLDAYQRKAQLGTDYRVQLRNWTTYALYQRKFLEPVYEDQMGYWIYKLK
jgi:4-amino-4-deoxy-L-arabinose transferase-like glycosyltransferase